MQSFKIINSPNRESQEPNDTLHTSRTGISGQIFFELFQYVVGDTNKNNGLSSQFLNDTGATCSFINRETFREIKKSQSLVVMPREKLPLAANDLPCP